MFVDILVDHNSFSPKCPGKNVQRDTGPPKGRNRLPSNGSARPRSEPRPCDLHGDTAIETRCTQGNGLAKNRETDLAAV